MYAYTPQHMHILSQNRVAAAPVCKSGAVNLATRNRARDHLIAANIYSQMLCQLSYRQDDMFIMASTHHADG